VIAFMKTLGGGTIIRRDVVETRVAREELDIDKFNPERIFDPSELPFPSFMRDANSRFVNSFLRHRHF